MSARLDRLAFDFFKLFGQFEFALKAMGYGRAKKNDAAEADWDRFANEIGRKVLDVDDAPLCEAIDYLFTAPPKRQVWIDGGVRWALADNTGRSASDLFAHIRRMRNNLYHGGKFHAGWIDLDRSETLMRHSLTVLRALLPLDERIAQAAYGSWR